MKKFNLFSFLMLLSFVAFEGCGKKSTGGVEEMHWDRDMCERCQMAISDRKFAVQIIDPKSGKAYKFDEIGCAVLWLDETKRPWKDKAIIWVTDARNGKWIDARKAHYVEGAITPMAFGFAAYGKETLPKDAKAYDYQSVAKKIEEIERSNSKKVKAY